MRREDFLLFLSALFPTPRPSQAGGSLADPVPSADFIAINANVITVDSTNPSAQAFAVGNGRFTSVGTNAEVLRLRTSSTQVRDLEGGTIVPGFNDAHVHPRTIFLEGSPYYTPWLGPDTAKNMSDLVRILRAKAARTPAGKLVGGYGYDDVTLGRHPTRHDLDLVSTTQPVSITHASGHITVVNGFVLQATAIDRQTQDPPGGALDRDRDGTPNGIVRESARALIEKAVGPATEVTIPAADRLEGMLNCFHGYAAKGITSVGVAGGSPESFREMEAVRDAGNPVRVGFMFVQRYVPQLTATGIARGFGDDRLRLTAIKNFQGNSLSGRTAWLSEAYSDRPGYFGIPPARSQEALDKDFQEMHDAGWQIATHSNGDREIAMVLTAIERAQAKNPRIDARHRIEHASVMNPNLLARAKRANVLLVFHSYMWEHGDKLASYGKKRLEYMHAYRTATDMAIRVAGHSDSPISAADPLLRIRDMVTRKSAQGVVYGGNQKVSVDEAIKIWTLDGAFATFEENIKGSITPGKLADFVILDKDPRNVPPDAIKDIRIDATYLEGKSVYSWTAQNAISHPPPPVRYGDGSETSNAACCAGC